MTDCLRKQLDKNTKVPVMTKYLHPSRLINEGIQNYESNHGLNTKYVVVGMEEKEINHLWSSYHFTVALWLQTNDDAPKIMWVQDGAK